MSFSEPDTEEYSEEVEDEEVEIKEQDKLEDFSIVFQVASMFDDLLAPPAIEAPLSQVVMRAESSGLPDGTVTYADNVAPIGETIDKFCARLSREANQAWTDWTSKPPEGFTLGASNHILDLQEKLLGEDKKYYEEIKRLKAIEDTIYQEEEDLKVKRLSSECTHFRFPHEDTEIKDRYYVKKEIIKGEFGQITVKETKLDRVAPGAKLKIIEGISSSKVERSIYRITAQESLERYNLTKHETEIWRKPARIEDSKYIPNAFSPEDDLDFIPPSSLISTNFNIYPPASRPYNCTFKVWFIPNPNYVQHTKNACLNEKYLSYKIYKPTSKKDYTSASSLAYMIKEKGFKCDFEVVIDEFMANGRAYPKCKFEPDLRVTYGDKLQPDPNNYKKVDPESVLGLKLLQLLNEQPYLWKEFSWEVTTDHEDGTTTTDKIVAVGFLIENPRDSFGKRIYWVYLNKDANAIGKPSFLRKKIIPPQFSYRPYKLKCSSKQIPFIASVRMSNGYFYYNKKREFVSFEQVVSDIKEYMYTKDYLFVRQEQESPYVNISVLHFIHKSMSTKQQRLQAHQKLQSESENESD